MTPEEVDHEYGRLEAVLIASFVGWYLATLVFLFALSEGIVP